MKNIYRFLLFSFIILIPCFAICAPINLTFYGKISNFTDKDKKIYQLKESDILGMKRYSLLTSTNWTPKKNFTGVLMKDLLDKVGAKGSLLEFHCLDDYIYTVPISEIIKYKVILAYERDGKRMAIKDLGPLGLIYPRDQYPKELSGPEVDAKFIWQVSKIMVK